MPCIDGQPTVLPVGAWTCSNIEPVSLPIPPINCNHHQAPHGYHYIDINGQCILIQSSTGMAVHAQSGNGVILGANQAVTSITALSSKITTWIQNNKGLSLVLGATAVYFFTKGK